MLDNKTLDDAILMHVNWLMRLENALEANYGEMLDVAELRDDSICQFGRWLQQNAGAFPDDNLHKTIVAAHRAFHHVASDAASMVKGFGKRGNMKVAFAQLNEVSDRLTSVLQNAKTVIAGKT